MKTIVSVLVLLAVVVGGTDIARAAWTGKVLSVKYVQRQGVVKILLEVKKGDGTIYLKKYAFGVRADEVIKKAKDDGITRKEALKRIVKGQIAVLEEQENAKKPAPTYTAPSTLVGTTVTN